MAKRVTVTVIGNEMVGKTTLLEKFTHQDALFGFDVRHVFNGEEYEIIGIDTPGHEESNKIRALAIATGNVILVCFDLNNKQSFEDVSNRWLPEIISSGVNIPIILVGTKSDLEEVIEDHEAHMLKLRIKARKYVRCSSVTGEGIEEVFNAAIACYNNGKITTTKKCNIM